jgi:hypothetical protein
MGIWLVIAPYAPELYDARRGLLERAGAGCAADSGFFDRTVHGVGTGSWGAFSAQLTKKNCLNQPSVLLASPTIGSYRPLGRELPPNNDVGTAVDNRYGTPLTLVFACLIFFHKKL